MESLEYEREIVVLTPHEGIEFLPRYINIHQRMNLWKKVVQAAEHHCSYLCAYQGVDEHVKASPLEFQAQMSRRTPPRFFKSRAEICSLMLPKLS